LTDPTSLIASSHGNSGLKFARLIILCAYYSADPPALQPCATDARSEGASGAKAGGNMCLFCLYEGQVVTDSRVGYTYSCIVMAQKEYYSIIDIIFFF